MKAYGATWIMLALGGIFYGFSLALDLDLFERIAVGLQQLEAYEADEAVVPVLLVAVGMCVDLLRRAHRARVEAGRVSIFRAVLDSMNHILNTFLNQAQLMELEAEECEKFDRKVLSYYRGAIDESALLIRRLSGVTTVSEQDIRDAVTEPVLSPPPGQA